MNGRSRRNSHPQHFDQPASRRMNEKIKRQLAILNILSWVCAINIPCNCFQISRMYPSMAQSVPISASKMWTLMFWSTCRKTAYQSFHSDTKTANNQKLKDIATNNFHIAQNALTFVSSLDDTHIKSTSNSIAMPSISLYDLLNIIQLGVTWVCALTVIDYCWKCRRAYEADWRTVRWFNEVNKL